MMMKSLVSVLVLLILAVSCVSGTIIVSDDFGSEIGLPLMGGTGTGGFTLNEAMVPLSPYNITVYITNELASYKGTYRPQSQSFYVVNSFDQGSLRNSFFMPGTLSADTNKVVYDGTITAGSYLGSTSSPNTAVGAYIYQFNIPAYASLNAKIVYSNEGNPTVTDFITINVLNNNANANN